MYYKKTFALVLLAAVVLAGCSHKGTGPEGVKYNIYIATLYYDDNGVATDPILILDADSLRVIDTIPRAGLVSHMEVSPNGRWLYTLVNEKTLNKIDTRTKRVVWSTYVGERRRSLVMLKGGALLLVGDATLIDGSSAAVVHDFEDSLWRRDGPVSGTKVAAVVRDSSNRIRVTDVETGEVYGNYIPRLRSGIVVNITRAVLHPDGRRVLAIGVYGDPSYSWFLVGDLMTGQTLLEYRFNSWRGKIAVSNDGKLVAATDPGMPFRGTPRGLDILDLEQMRHVKRFDAASGLYPFSIGQVDFLPGDRRVVSAPLGDYWSGGPLSIVDLTSLIVQDTIWLPNSDSSTGIGEAVGALGLGPRP